MVLQALLGLFGKAGSGAAAGAGAGAGSLFTQLAGGFPIGFLGGAGYGSGLRFGFEKLYDQWFKNLDTQSIDQVVPAMQGAFGISADFAGNLSGNQKKQGATINDVLPYDPINPPLPDYEGPEIPDSSLQATPAQKTATLDFEQRWYNNSGKIVRTKIERISNTKQGHLETIRKMREIKFRSKGLQATQAWKIIAYSKAYHAHYGEWPQ